MSEEQQKKSRLLAYWLFSTVLIVFGAITAYIALWTLPMGASPMSAIWMGLPIWGTVVVAAIIIYAGYYFYTKSKSA
ncbi:MAG TPA: hypothetical protein G4N96_13120 [Chloroflexi bacterium]|nr:hypothetical protein [Chloroflexota bacterium]